MKNKFQLFSMALCACMFAACEDDEGGENTGNIDKSPVQYVVMSGSGEGNGAYLQLTSNPAAGTIDPTDPNGRTFFSGNNPDFINYNNEILIGMNYPSQGGSPSDYVTMAWKLFDGKLVQHGSGVSLDGDVKARGIFKNYLIGLSDQANDYDHYERVKFIELNGFGSAVVDGNLDCDDFSKEPASRMDGEAWGVGDVAQYGDYVLLSYTTKHLVKDGASGAKAKASYSTDLANNLYLGVYTFDPNDADKEYLKYQNMIIRKSEDHPGEEAGQIKGNLRSRTETGIEVIGDDIYLFCQGSKNSGQTAPEVPSAVLRISGNNIQNGKPVAIDSDYYVNLTDKTGGYYMWKCFYLGSNKFCLQLFTNPGGAGYSEGSHKRFGIFDVASQTYTAVTGLPDPDIIKDIALAYAVDTDNGTITFEIETSDSQLPALYTINREGKATRGTEVDAESILGVSLLEQK